MPVLAWLEREPAARARGSPLQLRQLTRCPSAPPAPPPCRRCYEVQCVPMKLKDGYGNALDRSGACKDSSKSVVVTITDT